MNYDRWSVENAFSADKVQQLLDLTNKPCDSSIPNRVDTWIIDPKIIADELKRLFGEITEVSVTIKRWHNTSRLHADGNDYHYTAYVPLHSTSKGLGSTLLFNGKWRGDYVVFDKKRDTTSDGKEVKTDLDGVEIVDIPAIEGYNKQYIRHVPQEMLEQLNVIEDYPFKVGTAYIWEPTYLHCSSSWHRYYEPGNTRTHLLVAVKII